MEPKMYEYQGVSKCSGDTWIYSSPVINPPGGWSEGIFVRWYRKLLYFRRYGRWSASLTISRYYQTDTEDTKNFVQKEWDGFYLANQYIPVLKLGIFFTLMRLPPAQKVYPKKRYKNLVREFGYDITGIPAVKRVL